MIGILRKYFGYSVLAAGFILTASLLAPPFRAQNSTLVATRVSTSPDPVWFSVDGQAYWSGNTFNWPAGSKHVLYADPVQAGLRNGVRYTFEGWKAGQKQLEEGNPVTITADPSLGAFQASYQKEYALTVVMPGCDEEPCVAMGKVYAGGALVTKTTVLWNGPGATVTLQAVPNPGYVFGGWSNNNNGQVVQGFLASVTLNDPMSVTPIFQVARQIRLETVPAGLQVMADRSLLLTPATLEWGRGSSHTLSPVTPQQDQQGRWWVFESWSDNGAATHSYKVADVMAPDTVVAAYNRAVRATIITQPPGLKLKIDGRETMPPYNYVWGLKETHHIEAPLRHVDGQGRTWVFDSWSDGLAAAHSVTVPALDPADPAVDLGMRFVASYRQLGRVNITSNVSGLVAVVDGADCRTPCSVERHLGTEIRVSAPANVAMGEATRADFDRWSDGSSGTAVVTAATDPISLAANYRIMNRLHVSAEPVEGAVARTAPESADGFYESGTAVSVSMAVRPGFRFRGWEGDLSGRFPAGTVLMNQPRAARATFERVPFIPPAGVRNAAADVAGDGVAPGSIVAIAGAHLAGATLSGPESPLSQTLGEVTVRTGDRLLPLVAISPERITAMLPSDLSEGATSLAVKWAGQPEVRAEFNVVRNGPGLFRDVKDERAWAVAAHEDGSLVTGESPARKGERITIFGTGLGPTEPQRPLGFAIPAAPAFRLVDAVAVVLSGAPIAPEASYAAPGRAGVDAVEFRVPADASSGPVELLVQTGGRDSNVVLLPIE